MRLYDLVLVLKTSLSEIQRKKILDTIKGWMGDVTIAKSESLGQKVLGYPIKREKDGYYVLLSLEAENSIPADFEKRVLAQDDILRHLLIRSK